MASTPSGRYGLEILRQRRKPPAHRRRARRPRPVGLEWLEPRTLMTGGTWTEVNTNPFDFNGTMELLTDGTVMVQGYLSATDNNGVSGYWYKLSPDAQGNYADGAWSQLASMNTQRLYYASNVLPSGKLFVYGGEYSGPSGDENVVNSGEIYDPVADTWTPVTTNPLPIAIANQFGNSGYNAFGDDPSMLLPNGNILTGYIFGPQTEIYNPSTDSWSAGGTKLNNDPSDEETWVKLPNGKILAYEIFVNTDSAPGAAEVYDPSTNSWSATGSVPVQLSASQVTQPDGSPVAFYELGPALVLPNGNVFQLGGTGNTAIYNPSTNAWTAGPQIPTIGSGGVRYGADDAPAAVTTDGYVLFTADRPYGNGPTHMYEYDPVANTITDITSTLPSGLANELNNPNFNSPAFPDRMLALPNGQVMFNASYNDAWVFTPAGPTMTAGAPTITSIASNGSNSYTLTGTQLNGLSAGSSYGDDVESDTNYPIIRLTDASGNVSYARTTNWSLTGVQTGSTPETVDFTLPAAIAGLGNPVVTPESIAPVEGQALTNVPVATFTDPNGNHGASTYTALIDWGDGNVTTGTVSGPDGNNVYTVTGSHSAFTEEQTSLPIKVTVTDGYVSYDLTVVASGIPSTPMTFAPYFTQSSSTYGVADPAVTPTGGFTINAVAGTTSSVQTVATFTDPGGAEALGDYSATIDWGDTSTSAGTISGPDSNGVFTITGSHRYSGPGAFAVTTTIGHDAASTVTAQSTADVASIVTGVSSTVANGTYGIGAVIPITVTFDGPETVTGTPQLALNSGATVSYSSGSGTSTLTFTYTVAAGQSANPLDELSAGALTLNGGTIDSSSIPAVLTLASPGTTGSLGANKTIVIDTTAPTVTGVSSTTPNGTYDVGASIAITIGFSTAVNVTGTPVLALNSGGTASYSGGSGTTTLTFTYTVAAGQNANPLDEASSGALTLNGGTIKDGAGNAANLAVASPGTAGSLGANKSIIINTAVATVTGVSSTTPNGTYGVGASIAITISLSKAVNVAGTPQLALNSGGTASYSSGSGTTTLTFTYTVAAGQSANPLDEVSSSALTLNGGTISNADGNADLTVASPGATGSLGANKSIIINTTAPSVTGVSSTTANGTYTVGASIAITIGFSTAVNVTGTPQLALNSGGTAGYSSGSGTTTLTFTYTVAAGQNANPLDELSSGALMLNGGTIQDGLGNSANVTLSSPGTAGSLGANKTIVIDTTAPTVTGVSSTTPNGTYDVGATIAVTISFSEAVNVTGTPELALNSGGTGSYASGSGTNVLTFTYTVAAGQSANPLDEASGSALTLNGGTIEDVAGNAANLAVASPGTAGSLGANKSIVINTAVATVTGVSSTTPNGTYDVGASIVITIGFTKPVTVTGTPQLAFNSSGTADYTSGSGTTTLTFTYTVAAGQHANPLDEASTAALSLNGGTISNADGSADCTLPAPGTAGSLGANKSIIINTAVAAVTGVSSTTPNGTYGVGATIFVTIGFTKPVTVAGTPQLALNSGGTASYSSGSGTTTLTFTYTVAAGQNANPLDEVSSSALTLNGGTIANADGDADLTLPAPGTAGSLGANKSIIINTTAPSVTGISSTTANGSYTVGATIVITVGFSEPVNVTGTPQLTLNSGATVNYSSGSGTTTLIFTYIVAAGQNANPLDESSAGALTLNGGTIEDSIGNAANLAVASPGASGSLGVNKTIIIDTTAPTVLSFSVLFGAESYNLIGSTHFDLPWTISGIQVAFSKPITTGDVSSLTGVTTTGLSGLGTSTLTWSINAVSIGMFSTLLSGTGAHALKDAAGNSLSGGSGFAQGFNVLYGDVNGDGVVSSADFYTVYHAIGSVYDIFDDLNGDGSVNMTDVTIARSQIGKKLS